MNLPSEYYISWTIMHSSYILSLKLWQPCIFHHTCYPHASLLIPRTCASESVGAGLNVSTSLDGEGTQPVFSSFNASKEVTIILVKLLSKLVIIIIFIAIIEVSWITSITHITIARPYWEREFDIVIIFKITKIINIEKKAILYMLVSLQGLRLTSHTSIDDSIEKTDSAFWAVSVPAGIPYTTFIPTVFRSCCLCIYAMS